MTADRDRWGPPAEPSPADSQTRAAFVTAAVAVLSAALVFTKTGRDALLVQGRGPFDLPAAYLGMAVLAGPLAGVVLGLLRALGPRRVRVLLPVAAAVVLVWFAAVVRPGGGPLMTAFFMFVPLVWGVVFSVAWLLAADLLEGARPDDVGRGFGRIGSGAIAGGALAGLAGRLLASHVEAAAFVHIGAGGLLAAAALMSLAHRRYPARRSAPEGRGDATTHRWLGDRHTLALLGAGMAGGLVGILVEFQFYVAAAAAGGSTQEQAGRFAGFYLALNAMALLAQVWAVPRMQRRFEVAGSLLVLPLVMLGGAVALAASASLAAVVRLAEGGLKASLHRSSWEQAYLPLRSDRTKVKIVVEGIGIRAAEGMAALLLLGWLRFHAGGDPPADPSMEGFPWLVGFLALGSLLWVVATRRLGRQLRDGGQDPPRNHACLAPLPDS